MYKAIGKKFQVSAPFPPGSRLFSAHNISGTLSGERVPMLRDYMEELVKQPGATKDVHIMGLLCLSEVYDELSQKIEDKAIEQTLTDLGMGEVVYNDVVDGLTAIIIAKIKDEMWEEILAACPPSEKAREAALKLANKGLNQIVTPIVSTGIKAAKEQTAGVRKAIMDKLEEVAVVAVKAKHFVLNKLNEVIQALLTPIAHEISTAVTRTSCVLLPIILKPFAPIFQTAHQGMETLILGLPESDFSSESALEDCEELFDDVRKTVKDLDKTTKETMKNLMGDFGTYVTGPIASGLLLLLRALIHVIELAVTWVLDSSAWFLLFDQMIAWRNEMLQRDPSDSEAFDSFCEKARDDTLEAIEGVRMMLKQQMMFEYYKSGLPLFEEMGLGSSALCTELKSFVKDLHEVLYVKFFKRMASKFDSYLWGAVTLPTDTRGYQIKVMDSFLLGFRSAARKTKKGFNDCVVKHIASLIEAPIFKIINEQLTPTIKEGIGSITESVPQTVRDLVDVEGMVVTTLKDEVHKVCEIVVKEQVGAFKTEYHRATGLDYDAPFLGDIESFPYDYSLGFPQGTSGTPATSTTTTTTTTTTP